MSDIGFPINPINIAITEITSNLPILVLTVADPKGKQLHIQVTECDNSSRKTRQCCATHSHRWWGATIRSAC